MMQLDEQLSKERTQLATQRQQLADRAPSQSRDGVEQGGAALLPGVVEGRSGPSIDQVDAARRASPTAAAAAAALHKELEGAKDQIQILTQRMRELEAVPDGQAQTRPLSIEDARDLSVPNPDENTPEAEVATSYEMACRTSCWTSVGRSPGVSRILPAKAVLQRASE